MAEFSTPTATVVSIAQSLLMAEKENEPITAARITEKVDISASVVAPGNEQTIDKAAVIAELIRRFSLWIGQDTVLSDTKVTSIGWGQPARRIGATGRAIVTCLSARCRPPPWMLLTSPPTAF